MMNVERTQYEAFGRELNAMITLVDSLRHRMQAKNCDGWVNVDDASRALSRAAGRVHLAMTPRVPFVE